MNWIADLLVCLWNGKHIWIEVKQPKWVVSELQLHRQKQFTAIGDIFLIVKWYDDFLLEIKKLGL